MHASEPYSKFLLEVEARISTTEKLRVYHHKCLNTAEESGNKKEAADARSMIIHQNAVLDALRGVEKAARDARDSRKLPFESMISALERSCVKLETAQDAQDQNRSVAFQQSLIGGSRVEYEKATESWRRATAQFLEMVSLLSAARRLHES